MKSAKKWIAIAARYGKVEILSESFDLFESALRLLRSLTEDGACFPIAIINTAENEYWHFSCITQAGAEKELKRLGISPRYISSFDL